MVKQEKEVSTLSLNIKSLGKRQVFSVGLVVIDNFNAQKNIALRKNSFIPLLKSEVMIKQPRIQAI